MKKSIFKTIPRWIIIIIIVYTLIFGFISLDRHNTFHSGWDLGIFEDSMHNTFKGKFFYNNDFEMNFLGNHFNLFYILFAQPIYYIFPYTGSILFLQAFFLIIGIIPLYWLTKLKLKKEYFARIIVITYALFPITWIINLEDFHPNIFAVPLILFVFYYMEKKDWKKYFVFLALLLMVQEEIAFIVMALGIYMLLVKNRKIGLLTLIIGLLWLQLVVGWIMPQLNTSEAFGEGYFFMNLRYDYLGEDFSEAAKTIVLNPVRAFTHTPADNKITFILFYLKAFIFIPLLSLSFIVLLPIILLNILSTDSFQICPNSHHSVYLIPMLFVSFVYGLRNIQKWFSTRIAKIVIIVFLVSIIITSGMLGVAPWFVKEPVVNDQFFGGQGCFKNEYRLISKTEFHPTQKHYKEMHELLKTIPMNVSIIAAQHVYPHLIKRDSTKSFHFFDLEYSSKEKILQEESDYLLIDPSDVWTAFESEMYEGENYQLSIYGYKKIYELDGIFLFRKGD